ncbi:hypothetical protein HMN09_01053400 [Mycena chlorophos]|uniref:F-box domain-containing protein n=1 Tax=Mycena chlorophos TaxID=658473 RepID=A0A8H6W218_MYCCL|nr:hypothetical protein HMN09_01053400 [Mycena chlorophos]
MSFNDLPPELLLKLPHFLYSMEELLALSSLSRALYRTCANPPPKVISRLAANSGRVFFRPHPHLLIAATARELADWAVQANERRFELEEALRGGVDKLLELAIDVVGLTMADIRRLWRFKFDVLNPLDRKLDVEAGPATGQPWTVCNDPETTLVSWVIYGELFHHSLELGYLPVDATRPHPLSSVTRYKWLTYCVPDVNCFDYLGFSEKPQFFLEYKQEDTDKFQQLSMQTAIREGFLNGAGWENALASTVAFQALDQDLRPVLTRCAMHLGFRSLELLVSGGPDKLAEDLRALAAQLVDALPAPQSSNDFASNPSLSPDWTDNIPPRVSRRNTQLRADIPELVRDRWWSTGFPGLAEDVHFTLWGDWLTLPELDDDDSDLEQLEMDLKQAIRTRTMLNPVSSDDET